MSARSIKQKRWYNNTWLQIVVGYLLLSPIGSTIYDHAKNVPILSELVLRPLNWLWNEIVTVSSFKISLWIIALSFAIFYVAKWLVKNIVHTRTEYDLPQPKFLSYKKDILKRWKWEWEYKQTPRGYIVDNLRPICNNDETPLVRNYPRGLICPRCEMHYGAGFMKALTITVKI